ncbi:hypothetical protein COJ85_25285 [Bacillus sp. AFS076308]|uniref:hypothetical protein n=1 Tax=unclassified Bacillus (in: firmicutes) TaxID=185979 RepID=UPI000BF8756E|nr:MULTISPECIES: hypothetical protein [unclassified Bacillus (in: firmicutes)]PFN95893.1 hypothetical protein COJ85_25285 [Bacillus sp. AFS076308]PGV49230.1 hypothetical protein COD92_22890 [Bacillus sp. AFS037270]
MFSEINAKLVEIQGELRKKDKYNLQMEEYKRELSMVINIIEELRARLNSEQKDVHKLESISLTNLIATLTGTKDEKLAKEKQELIVAQHKLEEAEKTKREIDKAMEDLREKLLNLNRAEYNYQQLLLQKENIVKASTSPFAAKVFELSEQEGVLKSYVNELDEAKAAGNAVVRTLAHAISALEKAEGWGTWDLLGGGTISDLVKHQHIDKAEKFLHHAQTGMRQFQKELLDIKETALLQVNISGMLKFADFFFDGFIADFMVQGKIQKSLQNTRNQYAKIKEILQKLDVLADEKMIELEAIKKEKLEIVERL